MYTCRTLGSTIDLDLTQTDLSTFMYTHISVQQDGLPAVAHAALRLKIL